MRTRILYALMALVLMLSVGTARAQSWSNGGTGGGGGGPGGAPGGISGSLQLNNAGNFGGTFGGGDATWNGSQFTVSKTGGVSFAPSATTDTTNASNINSGTIAYVRLPSSGVTAGSYTSANITVNAQGIVTGATNGSGGGGGGATLIDYSALPGCGSTPVEYYVTHVPSGACRANWPVISAGANWISAAMALQAGSPPTPPSLHGSTAAQNSNGNAQSLVVPMPTASSSDVAVLFVQCFENNTDIPTPADWTLVNRHSRFESGAAIQLAVFARSGSGLLSNYTVGTSGNFQLAAAAYTISGTNGSLTPDSLVFADGNSPTPTISALSGLTGHYDIVLGVDDLQLPGFSGPVGMTQDQYVSQPLSNTTTQAGMWAGHLTLSNSTSSTAQTGIWNAPSATGPTCKLSCSGNSGQYVEEGF